MGREDEPQPSLDQHVDALLSASDREDAEQAVTDLLEFGEQAVRALTNRVRQLPVAAQSATVVLAETVGGRAGLSLLGQLLQLGDEAVENSAIYGIGNLGLPDGAGTLLKWLGGSADEEQLEAILVSLGSIINNNEPADWKAPLSAVDDSVLQEGRRALARESLDSDALIQLDSALRTESERRQLRSFGTLMDPHSEGLGRAFHREALVKSIEERLTGRGNRSLILVGPTGCGKTVLLHELCRRLGPDGPADVILQTSSGLLLAGTRYLGEWQTRVRDLIDVVRQNPRLVVYITDINNLLGAGTTSRSEENIADFLAPHIQSGELTLVGECTAEELRRGIEQRPAFRRLFQVIRVESSLPDETLRIAEKVGEHLGQRIERWLGRPLAFTESFYDRLLEIADQFRSSAARPGRAVDLLRATVKRVTRNAASSVERDGDEIVIEPHDVVETLARESGVPRSLLDDRQTLDLSAVDAFLSERVVGQTQAVDAVVDLVTLIKAGLTDPSKPTGVLFFVGPTGVGKTELAKALAEYMFGSQERMIRLDMSEFKELGSVERLIGSPHAPEWSPHRHGLLTGKIRQQPMSVVLLDEFEKAHQAVFDLLLQVMDDGRLTDAAGRVAHFTQAIIIMTSNLGGAELVQRGIGFANDGSPSRGADTSFRRELERNFRPEFINRIDRIVPFHPLDDDAMQRIVRREIGKVLMRSGIVRRKIAIDLDESVISLLLDKGFDPRYGARPLKREVERRILLPLGRAIVELGPRAEQALLRMWANGDEVRVDVIRSEPTTGVSAVAEAVEHEPQPDRNTEALLAEVTTLRSSARELENLANSEGLSERKSLLVQASGQPAFWDDPQLARRTLSEIHWLERLLVGVERVRKRSEDLLHLAESSGPRIDERLVTIQSRFDEVSADISVLRMAVRCRESDLRSDAFVTVERIDGADFEPDPALSLLRMYSAWAQKHRFRVDVVDENQQAGTLQAGTLFIEGLCPYGILRHESGIHHFVSWDQDSRRANSGGRKREKTTSFCRVVVRPVVDHQLTRNEVQVSVKKASGKGLVVPRYQTRIRLEDRRGGLTLDLTSDANQDDALALSEDFLAACLDYDDVSVLSSDKGSTPVRTYRWGSRPLVRDDRTGVRIESTDDVLNGLLEPFIEARMEREARASDVPADPDESMAPAH